MKLPTSIARVQEIQKTEKHVKLHYRNGVSETQSVGTIRQMILYSIGCKERKRDGKGIGNI